MAGAVVCSATFACSANAAGNGDGKADLITRLPSNGVVYVSVGSGQRFIDPENFAFRHTLTDLKFGDVDGDGDADMVSRQPGGGDLEVGISNGYAFEGTASWNRQFHNGGQPWHLADASGDAKADLIYRDPTTNIVWVALSDGTKFLNPVSFGVRPTLTDLKFGDVNGDGKADMVARQPGGGDLEVGLSNGSSFVGTASWNRQWGNPNEPWHLEDVTGDGRSDLITRLPSNNVVYVSVSDGSKFLDPVNFAFRSTLTDLKFGDVNGDGKADMVARQPGGGDLEVGLSNGSSFVGTASWNRQWGNPNEPWFLADVGKYYATSITYGNKGGAPNAVDTVQEADDVASLLRGGNDLAADTHRAGLRPPNELNYAGNRFKSLNPISYEYGGSNWKIDSDRDGNHFVWALRSDTDANTVQSDVLNKMSAGERSFVTTYMDERNPFSREHGGPNWRIDTTAEADHFIAALRSDTDANTIQSNALNRMFPEDRGFVTARMDATSPSSRTYGGPNWKVETAEADSVIAAMRARSDADALVLFNGLSPDETAVVHNRANAASPTSVTYGGGNWNVDTDAELRSLASAYEAASETSATSLRSGLHPDDLQRLQSSFGSGTPVLVPQTSVQVGPSEAPTSEELEQLGVTQDEIIASAAAAKIPDCNVIRQSIKIVDKVDNWPDRYLADAQYDVRVCFNKLKNKVSYGYKAPRTDASYFKVTMRGRYSSLGWDVTSEAANDQVNGSGTSRLTTERRFVLKQCYPKPLPGCPSTYEGRVQMAALPDKSTAIRLFS